MRGKRWSALALVVAVGVACSDSTAPAVDELVGTWNATEFTFSDFGDPVMDFDVIASNGSAQIVFRADSTYTYTITLPFSEPAVASGKWTLNGGKLTITESGASSGTELQVSLTGTTLTVYTNDLTFDFGNGEIPAQLNAKFVKQ
jgi:hypothetical protein